MKVKGHCSAEILIYAEQFYVKDERSMANVFPLMLKEAFEYELMKRMKKLQNGKAPVHFAVAQKC